MQCAYDSLFIIIGLIECCRASTRGFHVGLFYIGGITGGVLAITVLNAIKVFNCDVFALSKYRVSLFVFCCFDFITSIQLICFATRVGGWIITHAASPLLSVVLVNVLLKHTPESPFWLLTFVTPTGSLLLYPMIYFVHHSHQIDVCFR